MKVQFMGIRQAKKTGCSSCGRKRVSEYGFIRDKRMVLPSGRIIHFFVGQDYEVNGDDGAFLLSQSYICKGKALPMFKEA